MSQILNQPVLVLNKVWQPISDDKTVRRAVEDLTSGSLREGVWSAPFRAMDIELDPDGDLVYANPVDWDDWVKLPVRPGDDFLFTGRQYIRAPRVIIANNFERTTVRPVKLSRHAIKKRDKQQCQYCGHYFPMDELNIDHVIPRFHGGGDSWENMVCSCIGCNSKKGHKHNHEIGYTLLNEPTAPRPRTYLPGVKHPSWAPFMYQKDAK